MCLYSKKNRGAPFDIDATSNHTKVHCECTWKYLLLHAERAATIGSALLDMLLPWCLVSVIHWPLLICTDFPAVLRLQYIFSSHD